VLQVAVYFWNRRHNVSPHEEEGSSGVSGMAVSVMSTPVYVSAFWSALRGRGTGFRVTRKGVVGGDHIACFARHLVWAAVLLVALTVSQVLGHTRPSIRVWAVLSVAMCLLPVAIWAAGLVRARLRTPAPVLAAPDLVRAVVPAPAAVRFAGNHLVDVPRTQESSR
jgi:hypothetical protein